MSISPHPSTHLRAEGVSKSYPDRRVLTDISCTVSAGERIALIGENGTGKSTLLRVLAGIEPADAGEVTRAGRVGLLWQQPPFAADATVAEAVEDALRDPRAIARELEEATHLLATDPDAPEVADRYDRALAEATVADIWSLDRRAEMVLAGLGLGGIDPGRPVDRFSGGQRARLSLAWLLLARPRTLLLDEPTNHLDDAGVDYLTATLAEWPGPVLFASHDRAFLDEAATGLLDLDPAPVARERAAAAIGNGPDSGIGVTAWTGGYTDYLSARRTERQRWQKRYADEQDELRRLEREVRGAHTVGHVGAAPRTEARASKKFSADRNATAVSRRVHDTRRRLDELRSAQVRRPPAEVRFAGLPSGATGHRPEMAVSAVGVRVEHRLAETTLAVGGTEKWLITGINGAGKSTLLQVLAGHLDPTAGTVTRPGTVRVGLLTQDVRLDGTARVADWYLDRVGAEQAERRPLRATGLLHPREFSRRIGDLSIGQRRRLALAAVLADPPELLLLDEPTNHFSLLLADDLERALPGYPGAVVVASHDRWLRRRWSGRHLHLAPVPVA